MVRSEILEQIFTRVVTKSGSAITYLSLFKDIVEECPHILLNFMTKV